MPPSLSGRLKFAQRTRYWHPCWGRGTEAGTKCKVTSEAVYSCSCIGAADTPRQPAEMISEALLSLDIIMLQIGRAINIL